MGGKLRRRAGKTDTGTTGATEDQRPQRLRRLHAALVRVYGSASGYGDEPFQSPPSSPRVVTAAGSTLEVHFGQVPDRIPRARARTLVLGEVKVEARFHAEAPSGDDIAERLNAADAKPVNLAEPDRHRWFVALVLRREFDCDPTLVSNERWLWLAPQEYLRIECDMQSRRPTLDLCSQVLRFVCADVLHEEAIADRFFVSRSETFDDALSLPRPTVYGQGSARISMANFESQILKISVDEALENALSCEPLARDEQRAVRFRQALAEDRLAKEYGCFERYELERDLQRHLMITSAANPLAVMFIDMNGLKHINDTLGHEAGDRAIAAFCRAVRAAYSGDLYRIGGDEFVLFQCGPSGDAEQLARRILQRIAGQTIDGAGLSASIGIAVATNPLERPADLIGRADDEMYRAKDASRQQGRPCTLAIERQTPERLDSTTIAGTRLDTPAGTPINEPSQP